MDTIRTPHGFEAICRNMPGVQALIERSEPTSRVLGAGGLSNRWARYVVRGKPAVLGFFAVGDSHVQTNPMYGRGCAAAFVQAQALAEAVNATSDAAQRARRYEQRIWALMRPQYDFCLGAEQLYAGRGRRARGEPVPRSLRIADYFADQVWTPAVLESPFIARESVKVMQMQEVSGLWTRLATMLYMVLLWIGRGFRKVAPAPERCGPPRNELLSKLPARAEVAAE
jgi:hypothetical protein